MANTSIVTESARAAAAVNVLDYAASVRDHINGGWEKHHQVRVVSGAFPIGQTTSGDPIYAALPADQENRNPHAVNFPLMLRLQVTRIGSNGQDEPVNVLVPIVGWEDANSSALAAPQPPVIANPHADTYLSDTALALNGSVVLKVALTPADTSPSIPMVNPVVYQWRKNRVNIPGANARQLTVTMSSPSVAGDYQCVVAGFGGVAYSPVAKITRA